MSITRRSGATATFIFIGRLANLLFNVAVIVLITRYLGKETFGRYAFVQSYTFVLSTLATGGTFSILIREAASERERAGQHLGTALQIQFVFALVAFAAGVAILPLFNSDVLTTQAVYVASLAVILQSFANLYACIFTAFERTKFWALTTTIEGGLYLGLVVWVVVSGGEFLTIFWMRVVSFGVKLVLNAVIVRYRFTRTVWRLDVAAARYFARESFPLIFSDTFRSLDRQLDTFLLKLWSTVAQIGVFSAPYRLIDRMVILPDSIMAGFLPALSQLSTSDRERLQALYGKVFKFFLLFALPIAVIGTFLARPLVVLFFTDEYLESVVVLRVLVWIVLCMFPNYLFKYVLTAIGRQRYETVSRFISVGTHLVLGWLLIPRWGALGAAVSALASQVILFVVGFTYVSLGLQPYWPYRLLLKLAGLTLLVGLLLQMLANAPLVLVLPLAAAAYLAGYLVLRILRPDELRAFGEILGLRKRGVAAEGAPATGSRGHR